MPRYDKIYETLARRAVRQGVLDIETFIDQAINAGMSVDRAQEMLLADLEAGGPIFGKFLRQMGGAAEKSTAAAFRQGQRAGELQASQTLQRLTRITQQERSLIDQAVDDADPEILEDIEGSMAQVIEYMWVAELINTCHLCLPLHGQKRTLDEWQAVGLHPDSIHPADWRSACHCNLMPMTPGTEIEMRSSEIAPLKREKVETATGLKGSKKTRRAVTQRDMEKALAARDAAMETEAGRRTLRILGQSKKPAPEPKKK